MSKKPTDDLPPEPGWDPREHGHETWAGVFKEIRDDEAARRYEQEFGWLPSDPEPTVPEPKHDEMARDEQERGGIER